MPGFTSQRRRFETLMRFRVHDILLVSSPYDYFTLEEDGQLNELLNVEYHELNLSYVPRITHVATAEEALERLHRRRFELVITMARVGEMEVHEFGRRVKELQPGLQVVLLTYNTRELAVFEQGDGIDRVMVWSGDAGIMLAIIKLVEDEHNVAHDTTEGEVQVLILIEDSVQFYSRYLPRLYHELMRQMRSLMLEGGNLHHKLLRMRARAKVLLATSFEEAQRHYEHYADHLLGLIADVGIPRDGKHDAQAGADFVRQVQAQHPHLPVLFQSAIAANHRVAESLGAEFIDKRNPALLKQIRRFLVDRLGFGDFIFQMPDGREIGRAGDLRSMLGIAPEIPPESLHYHAQRNHFSNWFRARTELNLAAAVAPRQVADFDSLEALRRDLIDTLTRFLHERREGGVADFTHQQFSAESSFMRLGGGSLGGKGRGLAFFHEQLPNMGLAERFPDVEVTIPATTVVGTSVFDRFMEENDLAERAYGDADDREIAAAFLAARLPDTIYDDLRIFAEQADYPLAVRSSSLLEDAQHQPFAGIYQTYMLPNNHPDPKVRLQLLCDALRLVYASTFYRASRAYLAATPNRLEEEKMAVVLQRVLGRRHGSRFYPTFAGVARSLNFYPIGDIQSTEGFVNVALGLGKTVVEGERSLRFSPAHPQKLYQFATVDEALRNSQREFWALDMDFAAHRLTPDPEATLQRCTLEVAERDGQLYSLGATYSPDADAIYDGISRPGPRLVNFAGVLKHGSFPLTGIVQELLRVGAEGFSGPVEIEFAVELDVRRRVRRFGFLQIRPLIAEAVDARVALDGCEDDALVVSPVVMGNGVIDGLRDIVYVHPARLDRSRTAGIAAAIEALNIDLVAAQRPYLLLGPGRWGSADPWLGIPVKWPDVSGARAVVECDLADFRVTPSQGTHFFQNIVSFSVGYLTVNDGDGESSGSIDWDWLDAQPAAHERDALRHVRLAAPVQVLLDGRSGRGVVLKPGSAPPVSTA